MAPRWVKRYMPKPERFAHGYTEAKHLMVAFAIVGEVLQGGLVFGWNALALMLQARNNFAGKCNNPDECERRTASTAWPTCCVCLLCSL